jgi:hypothetical protein
LFQSRVTLLGNIAFGSVLPRSAWIAKFEP